LITIENLFDTKARSRINAAEVTVAIQLNQEPTEKGVIPARLRHLGGVFGAFLFLFGQQKERRNFENPGSVIAWQFNRRLVNSKNQFCSQIFTKFATGLI